MARSVYPKEFSVCAACVTPGARPERLVFDCNCLAQCLRSYGGPRGRGSFLRAKYPCNRTSSACAPPACQGGGEGTGCWVEDLDFRVEV